MVAQAQYALLSGETVLQLLQELGAGGVLVPDIILMVAQAQYALLSSETALQLLQELGTGGVVPPEFMRIARGENQAQAAQHRPRPGFSRGSRILCEY
jgi:hypothetical protein